MRCKCEIAAIVICPADCGKKAEFVKLLRKSYKEGNKDYLRRVRDVDLPQLKAWYEEFVELHQKQWLSTYKPFGYEVLSFRFGGVMARVDYAMSVMENYLNGSLDKIDELEEEILINEESHATEVRYLITPSGSIS